MKETAPVYAGANLFLKIISVNIKNPFKKIVEKAGYNLLNEKEATTLCGRTWRVTADIQEGRRIDEAKEERGGEDADL